MNASGKKVAFLVDFDNVATDVIEQALHMVFKDYGAAHIRRAYCNAEQALREQHFLKRLGLRAIVNLAIGKNSTDIALAADAMDLAITEKPDVIVLVSSDSDFAPLVLRLREKGAWLRGFGQYGKTGDGVIQIYDQFNELAHGVGRHPRDAAPAKAPGSSRRRGGRGGGRAAAEGRPNPGSSGAPQRTPRTEALPELAAAPVVETTVELLDVAPAPAPQAQPVVDAAPAKPAAKPAGKAAGRGRRKPEAPMEASAEASEASGADEAPTAMAEAVDAPAAARTQPVKAEKADKAAKAEKPAKAGKPVKGGKVVNAEKAEKAGPAAKAAQGAASAAAGAASPAPAVDPQVAAAKEINAVLALLPKLVDGQWHDLGAAAKVLKDAGLLAKSAPSTKLFRKHPHAFELQPEKQPNRVRFAT